MQSKPQLWAYLREQSAKSRFFVTGLVKKLEIELLLLLRLLLARVGELLRTEEAEADADELAILGDIGIDTSASLVLPWVFSWSFSPSTGEGEGELNGDGGGDCKTASGSRTVISRAAFSKLFFAFSTHSLGRQNL